MNTESQITEWLRKLNNLKIYLIPSPEGLIVASLQTSLTNEQRECLEINLRKIIKRFTPAGENGGEMRIIFKLEMTLNDEIINFLQQMHKAGVYIGRYQDGVVVRAPQAILGG